MYKKAIKDAAKVAAAAAEDTLAEPSEPMDDENDSDDDTYTAFKDIDDIKAIGVEDKGDSVFN